MKNNTVLIIEDNALNLKLVKSLLSIQDYHVLEAPDAETGLRLAQEQTPDLILMDIQLPGMSGLDATRTLKSDHSLRHIPIIALTSYAMKGDKETALAAGCAAYISKPIDTRLFPLVIEQHLSYKSAALDLPDIAYSDVG